MGIEVTGNPKTVECELCGCDISFTTYKAVVEGLRKTACHECFFNHINKVYGNRVNKAEPKGLGYEEFSRRFMIS